MNKSYRIIPCYSGDVSGVCSALYELGGMVVIHDPSGCNSTYNTHDETRWYKQDSLIFISGLKERDAIMGNDEKFINDIIAAAQVHYPKFIAICSSPIPYINGTDFKGICKLVEERTGIPTFFVETNGMHDYSVGAGEALKQIALRFTNPHVAPIPHSVNILGMTPLDYNYDETIDSLYKWLNRNGWKVNSCWAMRSSLEELALAGRASVNLVVSASGYAVAEVLREKFGTPFVCGVPIVHFEQNLLSALDEAAISGISSVPYANRQNRKMRDVVLIGDPVVMGSVAAAVSNKFGDTCTVICPLEANENLLGSADHFVVGEEEAEAYLKHATVVAADPLYRPICNPLAKFYNLPHQAFSGRCTWKNRFNIFEVDIK